MKRITHSDYEEFDLTGYEAHWTVVDNGEGANAAPGEATDLVFGYDPGSGAADYYCENGDLPPNFYGPILKGNVRVKP